MKNIVAILLFSVSFIFAGELVVSQPHQVFNDFTMGQYEDATASLNLEEIRQKEFTPTSNRISTGYSQSSFWFRFTIRNTMDEDLKYIIESTEAFAHEIDCFIVSQNGAIVKYEKGIGRYNKEHVVENKNPQFPIYLKSFEKKEIYIRQFGLFPNYTSFHVLDEESLFAYTLTHDRFISIYLGAALALILYNLLIFFYGRDDSYLFYVLYVFSFVLWQISLNGVSPLDTSSTIQAYYLWNSMTPIAIAFLLLFSSKILDTKRLFPRIDRSIKAFAYLYFALAIYAYFELHIAFVLVSTMTSLVFPYLLYVGFKSHYAGNKTAIFYIVAQSIFLLMSTIYALMTNGILEYNLITRYGSMVGSLLEMFLFSLALGYKLKLLQDEKIDIINKDKKELEQKVDERTQELLKVNQELQNLSITDKLTNVKNRLGLDNAIEDAFGRFKRYNHTFGIILMDIDYFKNVNDTYGHLVGDSVLKEITSLLKANIRNTDTIGRWGGEEFLVLCEESSLDGVKKLAQILKGAVEKYDFLQAGKITASFGTALVQQDDTKDSLLRCIDVALYKAKRSGRNKVC